MKKHVASAVWNGSLKEGNGTLTTKSKVLENHQYSFKSRFENGTARPILMNCWLHRMPDVLQWH